MKEPLFYSQNREDKWIAENLGHLLPEKGFYVDIGCGHPFETSNTAFLRDKKWEGLAIDANSGWKEDWKDIPAFVCELISGPPLSMVPFYADPDCRWHSRIDGDRGRMEHCLTIEDLLSKIGKVDFLSVDTEGTEFEILQSFDWEKHNPTIVVAEYNAQHLPIVEYVDSPIPWFMQGKGYRLRKVFPPVNMIFAHE